MYPYSYPSTHGISGLAAGGAWEQFEVHLKMTIEWTQAVIERVWRWNWRSRLSELRDALGGRDRATMEMQLETKIEWTLRCTWTPWSSEFRDAIGDRNWVNSEIHSEAMIERVWRCTWRPWSCELRDALRCCDRESLDMHIPAMIEREWRSSWRWSIWRRSMGGAPGAETLFIG